MLYQPARGCARIEHGLANGLNRATYVGADKMVCALNLAGPPLFVIRHRQSKRRDAETIKDSAKLYVAFGLSVPLRQDQHCAASSIFLRGRGKELRARKVVDGRRRLD